MGQKQSIATFKALGLLPQDGQTTKREHGQDLYPQLRKKVHLVGSCFLSGAIEMFAKAGCTKAELLEDAELVVFLGGEDVDPALYGQKLVAGTYINPARDAREADIFAKCIELDKPMFGICRGMQFLHVMNGGKLYQNVEKHVYTHNIVDMGGEIIRASSMHHQMCIENATTFPLAYAEKKGHGEAYTTGPSIMDGNGVSVLETNDHLDLEAAVYPNIRALAVQGHPEVGGYPEFTVWCLDQLVEWFENKFEMGANTKPLKDVPFLNNGVSS